MARRLLHYPRLGKDPQVMPNGLLGQRHLARKGSDRHAVLHANQFKQASRRRRPCGDQQFALSAWQGGVENPRELAPLFKVDKAGFLQNSYVMANVTPANAHEACKITLVQATPAPHDLKDGRPSRLIGAHAVSSEIEKYGRYPVSTGTVRASSM